MSVVDNYFNQPSLFNVGDTAIYETPEVKELKGKDIFVTITGIKSAENMLSENKLSVDDYGIEDLKSDYPDGHVYYGTLSEKLSYTKYNKFLEKNIVKELDVVNDISSSELKKIKQHHQGGRRRRRRHTKRAVKSSRLRRSAKRVRKTRR